VLSTDEEGPGLQPEINMVKDASVRLMVLKSVKREGALCAKLLRSPRRINEKDRIDEGSSPLYSLMSGHVAQSGDIPSRHPIVAESGKKSMPDYQLCAESVQPWAHSRGVEQCCTLMIPAAERRFRAERWNTLRTTKPGPEIDTGGERRFRNPTINQG